MKGEFVQVVWICEITSCLVQDSKAQKEKILDCAQYDVWGPTKNFSISGSIYFYTSSDDFSRNV